MKVTINNCLWTFAILLTGMLGGVGIYFITINLIALMLGKS